MTWGASLSKGIWLLLRLGAGVLALALWGLPISGAQERQDLLKPTSPAGQPRLGRYVTTAPDAAAFTPDELRRLRDGHYRVAIAMQALDTPWNALQVQAITDTLNKYGVEVVAVTDAAQDPQRQSAQLRVLADQKIHVLFSLPIDPSIQTPTYKRIGEAGIKLVLMDNVPNELVSGKDYVTVVASDNEQNAVFATEELMKAIGGRGEVALITYSYDSYHSITARRRGFERTLKSYPEVRLAAVEKFTQPAEVYLRVLAMLTAHPNIKGIFAVWADPAMQAVAAAQAMGRNDIIVTTNDLGPDSALFIAKGQIQATGAQLPYDLGVAEANAALYSLLGRPVEPHISLPGLGVTRDNLLSGLEMVTKQRAPPEVVAICGGKCGQ